MIALLCESTDAGATTLANWLRELSGLDVCMLTPEQLMYTREFCYHDSSGEVSASVRLVNGNTIGHQDIRGAINLISAPPTRHLSRVAVEDRDYMAQEMTAIMAAWIAALPCVVLNRSTATSLSGEFHQDIVWQHLALRAGLPLVSQTDSERGATRYNDYGGFDTVDLLVMEQGVFGASLSAKIEDALYKLRILSGVDLFQVQLRRQQPMQQRTEQFVSVQTAFNPARFGPGIAPALIRSLGLKR